MILEIWEGIFLQILHGSTKGSALLDIQLTNKEELFGAVKVDGKFDCNNHEILEFSMSKEKRKELQNYRRRLYQV